MWSVALALACASPPEPPCVERVYVVSFVEHVAVDTDAAQCGSLDDLEIDTALDVGSMSADGCEVDFVSCGDTTDLGEFYRLRCPRSDGVHELTLAWGPGFDGPTRDGLATYMVLVGAEARCSSAYDMRLR